MNDLKVKNDMQIKKCHQTDCASNNNISNYNNNNHILTII